MVPTPFRTEGAILPNVIPRHFEAFYRACLRRVPGSRVRSSDLMLAYANWSASEPDCPVINYQHMRRYMLALGHRHTKSNGIRYLDVAMARDVPDLGDTFCLVAVPEHVGPTMIGEALASIDAAVDQLHRVRRVLTGETPRS